MEDAASKSTDELKKELADLLGFTASNLVRLAVVVKELEQRGEDLSGIKLGLLPILRQIASGKLLPEIVVMYAGQAALIKKISTMPLEEQKQVVSKQRIVTLPPPRVKPANNTIGRRTLVLKDDDGEGVKGTVQSTIHGIALSGNPRDVGAMAAELILECKGRKEALRAFANKLRADAEPGFIEQANKLADMIREQPQKRPWDGSLDD